MRYGSLAALILAVIAGAVFFSGPTPTATPTPSVQCKWGFLRLRCLGAGCVRSGRKCMAISTSSAPSTSRADDLMRRRSVPNCLTAADVYEQASEAVSGNEAARLQLKAADALNCAMRIKGTGNIMLVDGTMDTPENKQFWGEHGARAYALVRSARSTDASLRSDSAAAAAEMDSFMYSSASKGILRQALTGAGSTFLSLANTLLNSHGSWDGGVAHCYLGGFYNVAPWPLGDKKRALREMEAAFSFEPRSRRNAYYACLMRYVHEDFGGADTACEAALYGRCEGPTTQDYCTGLTSQTERLLGMARKGKQHQAN
jgi:hypothetical protein